MRPTSTWNSSSSARSTVTSKNSSTDPPSIDLYGMSRRFGDCAWQPLEALNGDREADEAPAEQDCEVERIDADAACSGQDGVAQSVREVGKGERGGDDLQRRRQLGGGKEDAGDQQEW